MSGVNKDEEDYCPVCYTNMIKLRGDADEGTFIFTQCGHRYCVECTQEQMKTLIERNQLDKLNCFSVDC